MEERAREYEKATACIRSLIESGELRRGDRLPTERELSSRLGIGRNSIREALRTLEKMGVIRSVQGSGNYLDGEMSANFGGMIDLMLLMRTTSPEEIRNFRIHMEQTACDMILENPDAEQFLPEIGRVLEAFRVAAPAEKIELDRKFHYLLIQATGNRMLIFMMEGVMNVYRRWISAVLSDSACSEAELHAAHCAILNGLQNRDRAAIRRAIARHYAIIDEALSRRNHSPAIT